MANQVHITRNVKIQPRQQKQNIITNENVSIDVLTVIIANPHVSTKDIARDRNISQFSVLHVLGKNKFHLYCTSILQKLSQNDFNMRIQYTSSK